MVRVEINAIIIIKIRGIMKATRVLVKEEIIALNQAFIYLEEVFLLGR